MILTLITTSTTTTTTLQLRFPGVGRGFAFRILDLGFLVFAFRFSDLGFMQDLGGGGEFDLDLTFLEFATMEGGKRI